MKHEAQDFLSVNLCAPRLRDREVALAAGVLVELDLALLALVARDRVVAELPAVDRVLIRRVRAIGADCVRHFALLNSY